MRRERRYLLGFQRVPPVISGPAMSCDCVRQIVSDRWSPSMFRITSLELAKTRSWAQGVAGSNPVAPTKIPRSARPFGRSDVSRSCGALRGSAPASANPVAPTTTFVRLWSADRFGHLPTRGIRRSLGIGTNPVAPTKIPRSARPFCSERLPGNMPPFKT